MRLDVVEMRYQPLSHGCVPFRAHRPPKISRPPTPAGFPASRERQTLPPPMRCWPALIRQNRAVKGHRRGIDGPGAMTSGRRGGHNKWSPNIDLKGGFHGKGPASKR
ncbi:hypothetical protein NJB1907Z4_C29610 [Mycobacterium pseudoshottsii]|uniref:Uncharacterized protein n=1 Tax=Mycobacterium pseudoshottsii TaxID=265949 RepID=A0A9N7LRI0_9MYCO|nr:hypothetical protein NJB1907Z4_C29610 [Mycobacterium pseudoshottsii]